MEPQFAGWNQQFDYKGAKWFFFLKESIGVLCERRKFKDIEKLRDSSQKNIRLEVSLCDLHALL